MEESLKDEVWSDRLLAIALDVADVLRRPDAAGEVDFCLHHDKVPRIMKGMANQNGNEKRSEVEVPHPSYQPNARELNEDLRLKGTFEDAIKALIRPVKIRRVMPKRAK